jgi:dTDP-4-dehydrorhamnose 3,5-epimerase
VIFRETHLPGAFLIDIEPRVDERGLFARVWCREEFAAHGLDTRVAQMSVSVTRRRGTLRGMHFQAPPFAEAKLVRCVRGRIHDVIIDLRRQSPTFRQHLGVELAADTRRALYIPEGFAHGFQTLVDDVEVEYQMNAPSAPEASRGVRWNDPAFGIEWPLASPLLHPRDAAYPDFAMDVLA